MLKKLIYWARDRRITTAIFIVAMGIIVVGLKLREHYYFITGLAIALVGLDVLGFALYVAFAQPPRIEG